MSKPTGSNKENLEKTRAHLLKVATKCFAKNGYHHASTTMIIQQAGSSRGSLYHHFKDKQEIFKNVYDDLSQQLAEKINNYPYSGKDPLKDLLEGCTVYLSIFTNQTFAQIMLIDGPQVLGIEYCRSRDFETAYKALNEGILEIVGNKQKAQMLTDFLSGALDTYALRIARSKNKKKAFNEISNAFLKLAAKLFE